MTSKKFERLDKEESVRFYTTKGSCYTCPDCFNTLVEGPSGGLSINYYCNHCGSRFNETFNSVERINNKHNAPDNVTKFASQFDLNKLKFTLDWLATRAEKEEAMYLSKGDVNQANKSLDRLNFWVNFASRKYGISL